MKCPKCGKETNVSRTSYMSTKELCLECHEKEKNHPLYNLAKKVEREEVLKGNLNYPGLLEQYKGDDHLVIVMEAIDRENDETICEKITEYVENNEIQLPLILALIKNNICFRKESLSWIGNLLPSSIKNGETKEVYDAYMKEFGPALPGPLTNLSRLMSTKSQKIRDLYTEFCASYLTTEKNVGELC